MLGQSVHMPLVSCPVRPSTADTKKPRPSSQSFTPLRRHNPTAKRHCKQNDQQSSPQPIDAVLKAKWFARSSAIRERASALLVNTKNLDDAICGIMEPEIRYLSWHTGAWRTVRGHAHGWALSVGVADPPMFACPAPLPTCGPAVLPPLRSSFTWGQDAPMRFDDALHVLPSLDWSKRRLA